MLTYLQTPTQTAMTLKSSRSLRIVVIESRAISVVG